MATRRALHFVFKIGDRKATSTFYRDILGMKVLRHEEFEEGCSASCNGPYDGKWSKTMIGYGPEDDYFVCELTYNYSVFDYERGNDFLGIVIESSEALKRAQEAGKEVKKEGEYFVLEAPGGYPFYIVDKPQPIDRDPVQQVSLASSNLEKSLSYWKDILQMKIFDQDSESATLGYSPKQAKLTLKNIGQTVVHAKAFGRIAFSCPSSELKEIESQVKEKLHTVLVPYISLDTPGKAAVQVVILADPDGHEICFVGDEGFRELSKVDPKGTALLDEAIINDKSDEWFGKKTN